MTVISELGLVHVHVPKTAGYSVVSALGLDPWSRGYDPGRLSGYHPDGWNASHCTLMEILRLRPDVMSYLKTGVVREPYERVASLWTFVCKTERRHESFRDFVGRLPYLDGSALYVKFFLPQWEFLRVGSRLGVDLLGRYERLNEWWQELGARLTLDLPSLPHLNAGSLCNLHVLYDESTLRLVREVYAVDFEKFEYPEVPEWETT